MGEGRRTSRKGYSLVENLTAIFVVGLMIAVLVPTYIYCNKVIGHSRNVEQAVQIASGALETYRSSGYDALPDIAEGSSSISQPLEEASAMPNGVGSVTFTMVDSNLKETTDDQNRVMAKANVQWVSPSGDEGTVTLTTLITPQ